MAARIDLRWVCGVKARSVPEQQGVYVDALFFMSDGTRQKIAFIFEPGQEVKAAKLAQSLNEVLNDIPANS